MYVLLKIVPEIAVAVVGALIPSWLAARKLPTEALT